ncbi:ABC transporter ATP-binding protein [Tenggerimyces flavus]|uniref:ABC transporter ATP-binding protein n=1 Tax=Tenggerimyces flavus TaxID=1708749 RepID=A0ABV7Y761_9ACTN|nr:ABC transporter ATP-binding protein [Tenggerimyces flavus]
MTLVRAFPASVTFLFMLALLLGALPAIFALLVGRLVETLPAAVEGGMGSAAGGRVVTTLVWVTAVLVAREVVDGVYQVAKWDFYRRYEEYLMARVMRATLAAPRLELFEDREQAAVADKAVHIAGWEPGDLVDGWTTKWRVQAPGLASAVLVATVWPIAAVVVTAVWVLISRRLQADLHRSDLYAYGEALRHADYYSRIGQRIEWAKEVRVFGLVDWVAGRFGRQWAVILDEMWKARRVDQRSTTLLFVALAAANGGVLVLAARSAADGSLGIAGLTVLVQGLLGLAALADQDADNLIVYGSPHIPTVRELEQAVAAQSTRPAGTLVASGPAHEVRFDGVRFAYPGREEPVFDGLDLRIEAGTSLGIVGINGAGKTTLIKLLAGLEAPQAGRITVDGTDLADLDPDSWRRRVAAIFQDFVRYELPARDNIGFGSIDVRDDERIAEAAHRAGANDVLAGLPNGLDTLLSRRFPGGVDLSGGQWQRIALARAMVAVQAGARVLVLDEPTAQLDVRAEADIYDRFLDLTHGLTTIVISHRFSTVRRADRIVVLDAGRISEDGSHDELVAAGGTYARLFAKQAQRYHDAADGGDDA